MNRTATITELLSTEHLGPFLVVLALGMVIGALAVIALLAGVLDDEPSEPEPLTERMAAVPAPADLPRREWSL